MGSLSCQLACSNQLQCRIKHDSETVTYCLDKFSVFKKKKVDNLPHFRMWEKFYIVMKLSIFFSLLFFFIGSYGHCGSIANNLMLGQDRWRILILLGKFLFFWFQCFQVWFVVFMTGFGGTAQLLISYNYENGRISRRRFGFSVRDFV